MTSRLLSLGLLCVVLWLASLEHRMDLILNKTQDMKDSNTAQAYWLTKIRAENCRTGTGTIRGKEITYRRCP